MSMQRHNSAFLCDDTFIPTLRSRPHSASYAVSALSIHTMRIDYHVEPNNAIAWLIRKCCWSCNASQISFGEYFASWRRIGSEIFTSLLEILAVWENARCSRTICIHQRWRHSPLFSEGGSGGGNERTNERSGHAEAISTVNLHERFLECM